MAMHRFTFEPGGVDPEQFFRNLAPMQLVGAIHQAILLPSMPGRAHDAAALPAIIDTMMAKESLWLQRAIGNLIDFKTVAEHFLAGKLGEGLDMENIPAVGGFTDGARFNLRNALFFCWTALPEARRTWAEVERIVRVAISRQFGLIEEIRRAIIEIH